MSRYVGIDPSTHTGLVILNSIGEVVNAEEISTNAEMDLQRFVDIGTQIVKQIEPNDFICIEGFSYGSKGQGASFQYGLGWIIRYLLWERNNKYIDVSPSSVKKFATGKGNAKKDQMVLPIYKKWHFEHSSDNVRDAFVLARIAFELNHSNALTTYQGEVLKKITKKVS